MNTYHRRFVFVDFDNLKKVNFKKLEKVCDKVFVFINAEEESIPFALVQHMQKMGKAVKWILVETDYDPKINYLISFLMGRIHQKVDRSVEFAILSNDASFDPLVTYINVTGRSCLRVNREKNESDRLNFHPQKEMPKMESFVESAVNGEAYDGKPSSLFTTTLEKQDLIDRSAENTIKRLIRSGNRPSSVNLLKDYILLNNQELTLHSNVDKVIKKLEDSNEIKLMDEEVVYNF